MDSMMGSFEAKTKFAELLARVQSGESITITRHGEPVARLVPISGGDEERQKQRALVEEIKRWRVGKDKGAKAGSTIPDLIKAGRRY